MNFLLYLLLQNSGYFACALIPSYDIKFGLIKEILPDTIVNSFQTRYGNVCFFIDVSQMKWYVSEKYFRKYINSKRKKFKFIL